MFGKKKDTQSNVTPSQKTEGESEEVIQVRTIPDIFYGGKNPVIYAQQGAATVASQGPSVSTLPKPATAQSQMTAVHPKKSKKIFFVVAIISLFIIVVAGASYYYIQQYQSAQPPHNQGGGAQDEVSGVVPGETDVPPPEDVSKVPTTTIDTEPPTPTSSEVGEIETPSSLQDESIMFPRVIFRDTVDLDADGLTDLEEELFETDTGNFDTDGDGYEDGMEVVNLYNPGGTAPIRIIESGLVREYVHPRLRYRFYYPGSWEIGEVDVKANQVLVSSISGDYVEIRAFDRGDASFESWFGEYATGQKILDLTTEQNRFKEDGRVREDGLVAYYEKNNLVYVLVYHPASEGSIAYRHIMEMIIQSFRPDKSVEELPDQPVLPDEGVVDEEVVADLDTEEDSVTPSLDSVLEDGEDDIPDPTDAGTEF